MPAKKHRSRVQSPGSKPRKRNMQDTPISYYQSLERRVDKLEAAVKALKAKKPQPRDPRDDHYWRVAADRALAVVLKGRNRGR